jgi:hypothetical protein
LAANGLEVFGQFYATGRLGIVDGAGQELVEAAFFGGAQGDGGGDVVKVFEGVFGAGVFEQAAADVYLLGSIKARDGV